jgi:hypothetical protein
MLRWVTWKTQSPLLACWIIRQLPQRTAKCTQILLYAWLHVLAISVGLLYGRIPQVCTYSANTNGSLKPNYRSQFSSYYREQTIQTFVNPLEKEFLGHRKKYSYFVRTNTKSQFFLSTYVNVYDDNKKDNDSPLSWDHASPVRRRLFYLVSIVHGHEDNQFVRFVLSTPEDLFTGTCRCVGSLDCPCIPWAACCRGSDRSVAWTGSSFSSVALRILCS